MFELLVLVEVLLVLEAAVARSAGVNVPDLFLGSNTLNLGTVFFVVAVGLDGARGHDLVRFLDVSLQRLPGGAVRGAVVAWHGVRVLVLARVRGL